jgi:hypothetical protein
MVTFYIGSSKKEYPIFTKFAVYYSPVLAKALNRAVKRGQTQSYTSEDVSENAFSLFIQWMYGDKIEVQPKDDAKIGYEMSKEGDALFELWVLGDKLFVPKVQNKAIDLINDLRILHNTVWTSQLKYTYKETQKDSQLRQLLVDQIAGELDEKAFRASPHRYTVESLHDIVFACKKSTGYNQIAGNIADYHVDENKD